MRRGSNYLEKVKGHRSDKTDSLFDIAERDFLLTAEDAGKRLSVSKRTLYFWAQRGTIPCVKIGALVRFKDSDITKLISTSATS